MDTITILNLLQARFGRPVEVLTLDEDSIEFRCPWWCGGGGRKGCQFVVHSQGEDTSDELIDVFEVEDGITEKTPGAQRVLDLLRGYVRTEAGNMVPRSRLAECEAAGL